MSFPCISAELEPSVLCQSESKIPYLPKTKRFSCILKKKLEKDEAVELADYTIKTDFLAPVDKKTIEFNGFHPSKIIKMIPDLLKDTIRVEGGDVFEDKIKWDVSADPISFYGEWRAKYEFDMRSTASFKIVLMGSQNAKDKIGKIKVMIKGTLETKFPYTTFLHRSILWIYLYFFYNNQRRKYIDIGKILIDRIEDELRSAFNLIKRGG